MSLKEEKTEDRDLNNLNIEEETTKNIEEDSQEEPEEVVDWQDRYIRLSADFDNFRKRMQKEKSDIIKYSNEPLMMDLLPVIDNFQRAVEHSKQAKDIEAVRTGIEMIFNQLMLNLERYGIKVESYLNQEFDPNKHEAVSHISSEEVPNNHIIDEMQKAYFLHEKLLRPALVSVSKGSEYSEEDN